MSVLGPLAPLSKSVASTNGLSSSAVVAADDSGSPAVPFLRSNRSFVDLGFNERRGWQESCVLTVS